MTQRAGAWPFAFAIFDMDGLLFDTEALAAIAWARALDRFGVTSTDDVFARFIGRDLRHRKQVLVELFGTNFPTEDAARLRLEIGEELEGNGALKLKAGAPEILAALARDGVTMALATGCDRQRAVRRLRQFDLLGYFSALVCGDEVKVGKPSPVIYMEALRRLATRPSQALAFEDSVAGVESATRAELATIWIPDMESPALSQPRGGVVVLGSLPEVLDRGAEIASWWTSAWDVTR